jgi:spore coat protein A
MSTITWINEQEEGTLLYHDHSMAMTRLNFYAGLYGFLIIQDPDSPLSKSFDKNHDIFLAISSVSFNQDGSLYYPS